MQSVLDFRQRSIDSVIESAHIASETAKRTWDRYRVGQYAPPLSTVVSSRSGSVLICSVVWVLVRLDRRQICRYPLLRNPKVF